MDLEKPSNQESSHPFFLLPQQQWPYIQLQITQETTHKTILQAHTLARSLVILEAHTPKEAGHIDQKNHHFLIPLSLARSLVILEAASTPSSPPALLQLLLCVCCLLLLLLANSQSRPSDASRPVVVADAAGGGEVDVVGDRRRRSSRGCLLPP